MLEFIHDLGNSFGYCLYMFGLGFCALGLAAWTFACAYKTACSGVALLPSKKSSKEAAE